MNKKSETVEKEEVNTEVTKKHTIRKEELAWDKLDNTANLFPVIANQEMTNVYRISVSLTQEVDRVLLQEALNRVLPQFSIFRMRLRMGVFWYYFEENERPAPLVTQENSYPGAYIDKSRNNHYMFRVTYFGKRINLEVFHALTDGFGGTIFLKELIYQYLRLKYPEILEGEKDKISAGIFLDREDSYVRNFKKKSGRAAKGYKSNRALTLQGEKLPKGEVGVIHGYLPVEELKAAGKKHGITINQYLVGTFVYAVYEEVMKNGAFKAPISCCVPVNLRPYYDSHTMKNFFAMVSADFKPEKDSYTYEEVLQIVAESLREQITPENLDNIVSYNVSNQKNWILRLVPLVVKNFFIKQVYGASAYATSATITNIGNIELRKAYQPYVEHFYTTLSMSKGQNMKGAICSYNGILTITFSSVLASTSIQKLFFQMIARDGVEVAVETNDVYYEA